MDVRELRLAVEARGSKFFDKDAMKCFGDTFSNYYVAAKPMLVEAASGSTMCWLLKRRRPVKMGLQSTAYFACDDFRRVFPLSSGAYAEA